MLDYQSPRALPGYYPGLKELLHTLRAYLVNECHPGHPALSSCFRTHPHTFASTPNQNGAYFLASSSPLVVLCIRAEVCLVCAGESGQKDAARRRHLLQAPATPLQLPLTGIGEALRDVHARCVA